MMVFSRVKNTAKLRAPTLYWWTRRKQHVALTAVDSFGFRLSRVRAGRSNTFEVDLNVKAGFFASISAWLAVQYHCEVLGLRPDIRIVSGVYGDADVSKDWFRIYFDEVGGGNGSAEVGWLRTVRDVESLRLTTDLCSLNINEASNLFDRHATVKKEFVAMVDDLFATPSLSGKRILGVHYRGTDKFLEARAVPQTELVDAVRQELDRGLDYAVVLVASDERGCASALRDALPGVRVEEMPATYFGNGTTPPHMIRESNTYVLGVEALTTALALARCDALVRTTSYLSGWSKVFNPALRTVTLNQPDRPDTFPDATILALEEARTSLGGRPRAK